MRRFGKIGMMGVGIWMSACGAAPDLSQGVPSESESDVSASEGGITSPNSSGESAELLAARRAAVVELVGLEAANRVMPREGKLEPVYELVTAGGSVFWYEPMDGIVVVAQRGLGKLPLDIDIVDEGLSASELFTRLAPKAAIPDALRSLDQRVLEMRPVYAKLQAGKDRFPELHVRPVALNDTNSVLPTAVNRQEAHTKLDPGSFSGESVAKTSSALTSNECISRGWCAGYGGTWKVEQRDVTATRTASHSDTDFAYGNGCSINGTITYSARYRTWFSWTNWWSLDLPTGAMTTAWRRAGGGLDFDIEAKLSNFQTGDVGAQSMCGQ